MPDQRIFDELYNRELDTMALILATKATRTAVTLSEYIQLRLMQGTDAAILRDELLSDLNEGGRIFGEFRRAIKSTARGSVNRIRDDAYFSEFGTTTMYRWSAVLVNTCSVPGTLKGCLERHGLVKTWEEWEEIGLPRSGGTVCQENCHCVLVPDKFAEYEPIKRAKR